MEKTNDIASIDYVTEYVKYVTTQLNNFRKASKLIENDQVTPLTVNRALALYSEVNDSLIGEYERLNAELHKLEYGVGGYEEWWDDAFSKTRKIMIAEFESKSVKISVKEFESETRVNYRTEYREWQEKLFSTKSKLEFIKRKIEAWKKVDNILINLSYNMRAEMKTLSLDNRMNARRERTLAENEE